MKNILKNNYNNILKQDIITYTIKTSKYILVEINMFFKKISQLSNLFKK